MMNRGRKTADRYTGPLLTTDQWNSLEMRRWILEHETPGKFGTFGDKVTR